MKTFETEKHNIPDGATHYSDESDDGCFAWYKKIHNTPFLWCVGYEEEWIVMIKPDEFNDESVKPIPQTNIETPEEKEVLDTIKSVNLRDYQKTGKPRVKVEYVKWNFECAWHAIKAFEDGEQLYIERSYDDFILIDNAQDVIRFLYSIYERIECDETPEQREERERLEVAYDLFVHVQKSGNRSPLSFKLFCNERMNDYKSDYLSIVDKTNYRKEG